MRITKLLQLGGTLSLHSAIWHNMVVALSISHAQCSCHSNCYILHDLMHVVLIWFSAEVNAKDIVSEGALWELVRISRDCSREDIRMLAYRTLTSSPTLQSEMRRLRIECWWINRKMWLVSHRRWGAVQQVLAVKHIDPWYTQFSQAYTGGHRTCLCQPARVCTFVLPKIHFCPTEGQLKTLGGHSFIQILACDRFTLM
jgi:hypothetical protein